MHPCVFTCASGVHATFHIHTHPATRFIRDFLAFRQVPSAVMANPRLSVLSKEESEQPMKRQSSMERFRALKGTLVEVRLRKAPRHGFGLAIAGHRHRERMGTFICGLNPEGPAAKEGSLRPGDEILKVSETRSHASYL